MFLRNKELENKRLDHVFAIAKTRLLYGFILAIILILAAFVLVLLGHEVEGSIFGTMGIIGIVSVFTGRGGPPPQPDLVDATPQCA